MTEPLHASSATTVEPHPAAAPARGRRSTMNDAFFRHVVGGMRNGVLAITHEGRVALINDEAYRIFGVTPEPGDEGQPIARVLRDHPDVVRVLTAAFELHHLPNRAEMRLKPSGRVIGYTLGLVRDDGGAMIGASMFFKDLTRVEQLEERERLRDRLAVVGEMAAVIAHEVKNPLAGIEVMAGLLRRKATDPDVQKKLTDIISEAKMANAIVQEVLEFVRPIRLQMEHIPIESAIHAAIQHSDTKAARGAIDVELAIPADLPLIQADQHQLTQVFTNVLMNACEAMGGAGRIVITAGTVRLDDGGDGRAAVRIVVTDNGPGVPQEVADKVFEPFFTTKPQGSGLGLAIVRKIMDAHDGRIDLRSAPGEGATISVTLPVTADTTDASA